MKSVAVIPARGGSERLPNKNAILIDGMPLVASAVVSAKKSSVSDVYVTTDDTTIEGIARYWEATVHRRSRYTATSKAPIHLSVIECIRDVECGIVVILQANIPFRESGIVDRAIRKLRRTDHTSIVTVREVIDHPAWAKVDDGGKLEKYLAGSSPYRKQDLERLYVLDGSVQVVHKDVLMKSEHNDGLHCYLGKSIGYIVQKDPAYSLEIDTEDDVRLAEFYARGRCLN